MALTSALALPPHLLCYVLTFGSLYLLLHGPLAGSGALWVAMLRQVSERHL
jgi:hypothetical protein